jgi:hypothetical protein
VDDQLNQLLAAANPVGPPGSDITGALDALGREIIMQPRLLTNTSGARHRRRVIIAVTTVVTMGLGTGAAAAAGVGPFARTGRQAAGGENGTGEIIRTDASDALGVIARVGEGVPLPPGASLQSISASFASNTATEESESSIRSTIEFNAACRWTTYWLASKSSGDAAAMAKAQAVLDVVPTWKATMASDVTGEPGGVVDNWRKIAAQTRAADNVAVANNSFYTVNCSNI